MNFTDLEHDLRKFPVEKILFLALGNEQRADDGAGIVFTRQLQQYELFKSSGYIYAYTNPENHLQAMLDASSELIVCVDAAHRGQKPGSINWINSKVLDNACTSTHAFSISLIEQYICYHQSVQFKYLGIEPYTTQYAPQLSPIMIDSLKLFFSCIELADTLY